MDNETRAECTACGFSLDPYSAEPCPNCGKTGTKRVYKPLEAKVTVTATLDRAKIRNILTFNRLTIVGLVIITLISPLLGLFLPTLPAVLASYGLGVIGIVVGCSAITKVREIERYTGT